MIEQTERKKIFPWLLFAFAIISGALAGIFGAISSAQSNLNGIGFAIFAAVFFGTAVAFVVLTLLVWLIRYSRIRLKQERTNT